MLIKTLNRSQKWTILCIKRLYFLYRHFHFAFKNPCVITKKERMHLKPEMELTKHFLYQNNIPIWRNVIWICKKTRIFLLWLCFISRLIKVGAIRYWQQLCILFSWWYSNKHQYEHAPAKCFFSALHASTRRSSCQAESWPWGQQWKTGSTPVRSSHSLSQSHPVTSQSD